MRLLVVDTNVVVAGLITGDSASPTARIVNGMLDGSLLCLLSPDLLAEYRLVLLRPKISQRHGLNADQVDQILTEITLNALWREPLNSNHAPDPGDNHLWALLDSHPNSLLITGDQLLLDHAHDHALVMSPANFFGGTTP